MAITLPVTGAIAGDLGLITAAIVIGFFMAIKSGNKLGWAVVALAVAWGFAMMHKTGYL